MVVTAAVLAVVAAFVLRPGRPAAPPAPGATAAAADGAALPTLVELGSTNCIPCLEMAPIIRDLAADYAGSLRVRSIDVMASPDAARPYNIFVIPTQVFLGADGAELFRHEGFMSRQEVLDKWQAHGVRLRPAARPSAAQGDDGAQGSAEPGWIAGILTGMTRAIAGRPGVALAAAALWGILSVLLSPCHMASLPLIVGFIAGQGRMSTARAAATAGAFAGGILATIALVGAVTAAAGGLLGNVGPAGNYIAAGVFVLVGLHLLGAAPNPFSPPGQVGMKRRGIAAAAMLGLVFGLVLGPCTFSFLIPIIVVAFSLASGNAAYGAVLMLAYGIGYAAVIVLAGSSANLVQRYLAWGEKSRVPGAGRIICGLAMLAGGLWLIYAAA